MKKTLFVFAIAGLLSLPIASSQDAAAANLWDKIKSGTSKLANKVKKGVKSVGKRFKKAGKTAKSRFQKFGRSVRSRAKKIGEKVRSGFKKFGSRVRSGLKKAGGKIKKGFERFARGAKDLAKKALGGLKDLAKKVGVAAKTLAKKAKTAFVKLGKLGLKILTKIAKGAWKLLKKASCSGLLDKLFNRGAINKSSAAKMGGLWYAGKCGQEFTKGLLCSIPDMIFEVGRMVVESAKYAWKHKGVCITAGLLLGGLSPVAAGPILLCGAGFMLADKLPKAIRCAKKMLSGGGSGGSIWPTILEVGCNVAGSLVIDVVLAILSGGTSLPAVIGKHVGKLTASLTARLGAKTLTTAKKIADVKGVLSKAALASKQLNSMAECK